jgi:threonyl-tRNA synthetase
MTSEVTVAKPKEEKVKEIKEIKETKEDQPKDGSNVEQKKDKLDGDVAIPKNVQPPQPGYARPVMIHRAIYGSFERFFA